MVLDECAWGERVDEYFIGDVGAQDDQQRIGHLDDVDLKIIYIVNFMFVTINDKLWEVSYNLLRFEIDLPDADASILAATQ